MCSYAVAEATCNYCGEYFEERSTNIYENSYYSASCTSNEHWDCYATFTQIGSIQAICGVWHYGERAFGHYAEYADGISFGSGCLTATAEGSCERCGSYFSETVNTTKQSTRASTCTKGAWYDYYATFSQFGDSSSCPDYHYTGEAALGHSYTSTYKAGSNATYCTRKCSRCSTYGTSSTTHSWSTTTAATCTAAGSAKCSNCSQTKSIAQKSHSYTTKSTTSTYLKSSATCTAAATYYYKCSGCTAKGTSTYTSGSSLGHTGYSGKYPSCDSSVNCTRCGGVVYAKLNCCNTTYQVHYKKTTLLIFKTCYEYEVCANSDGTTTCRRYYSGPTKKSSCSLGDDRHLDLSDIRDLPSSAEP